MAIRLFISSWAASSVNGQVEVQATVTQYILANHDDVPVTMSMYYADADVNGLPDGSWCLVLVESDNLTGADLDAIKAQTGVKLIPPYAFGKRLSQLTVNQRNTLQTMVSGQGVDLTGVDGSTTIRQLIHRVIKHLNPAFSGFGERYEVDRQGEFG